MLLSKIEAALKLGISVELLGSFTKKCPKHDPDEIDQVECPRCGGRGTIRWAGAYCPFCRGFVRGEQRTG
jgi:hypothetical protein